MGRPTAWLIELTGRSAMISPGAPANGATSNGSSGERSREGARRRTRPGCGRVPCCREALVPAGWRNVDDQADRAWRGRYLSFPEREKIAILRAQDVGVRKIARRLDRDPATISRGFRRNPATRGEKLEYRASVAQWKAELMPGGPCPRRW